LLDTVKGFLGSIYGCFIVGAFVLGCFYFGFSRQWLFFGGWCLLFIIPWIYILDKRMQKNRELAKQGEIQIDSERQTKAIKDYFSIPSVRERIEEEEDEKEKTMP
jgi:amino acid permease